MGSPGSLWFTEPSVDQVREYVDQKISGLSEEWRVSYPIVGFWCARARADH